MALWCLCVLWHKCYAYVLLYFQFLRDFERSTNVNASEAMAQGIADIIDLANQKVLHNISTFPVGNIDASLMRRKLKVFHDCFAEKEEAPCSTLHWKLAAYFAVAKHSPTLTILSLKREKGALVCHDDFCWSESGKSVTVLVVIYGQIYKSDLVLAKRVTITVVQVPPLWLCTKFTSSKEPWQRRAAASLSEQRSSWHSRFPLQRAALFLCAWAHMSWIY